jgi:tetratricopeptide (TPR) repeat protein
MNHPSNDDLLRYRVDRSLVDDAESMASHIDACAACRLELEAIDEQDRELRAEATWLTVEAGTEPLKAGRTRVMALYKRIQRENAHARRVLQPLLRPTLRLTAANIATKPAFLHAGVVRVLLEEARDVQEKRPITAVDIAAEAYRVACLLPDDASTDRNLCKAYALRESANALRLLDRYRDALLALDEAEALFKKDSASDSFEFGIVKLSRAYVLYDSERFVEAERFAAEARVVFNEFPDPSRQLSATIVHALCLLELGDPAAAADSAECVIKIARDESELSYLARGALVAGNAYRRLGDLERSEERYVEAVEIFAELRLDTAAAYARFQIGINTALQGDLEAARHLLQASEIELLALGMTNEAALATLRWAEASLALGLAQGVADKCRGIVVVFDSAGLQKRARMALAYLQEALELQTATPDLAADVCEYIEVLPRRPDVPFVPRASA